MSYEPNTSSNTRFQPLSSIARALDVSEQQIALKLNQLGFSQVDGSPTQSGIDAGLAIQGLSNNSDNVRRWHIDRVRELFSLSQMTDEMRKYRDNLMRVVTIMRSDGWAQGNGSTSRELRGNLKALPIMERYEDLQGLISGLPVSDMHRRHLQYLLLAEIADEPNLPVKVLRDIFESDNYTLIQMLAHNWSLDELNRKKAWQLYEKLRHEPFPS